MAGLATSQTVKAATGHDLEGSRNSRAGMLGGGGARMALCVEHTLQGFGGAGDQGVWSHRCAPKPVRGPIPTGGARRGPLPITFPGKAPLKQRWGDKGDTKFKPALRGPRSSCR